MFTPETRACVSTTNSRWPSALSLVYWGNVVKPAPEEDTNWNDLTDSGSKSVIDAVDILYVIIVLPANVEAFPNLAPWEAENSESKFKIPPKSADADTNVPVVGTVFAANASNVTEADWAE